MSDNPPAFPQQCADALDVGMVHEGMSLRDWFAGQALAGIISRPLSPTQPTSPLQAQMAAAKIAYGFADAMLAERARQA